MSVARCAARLQRVFSAVSRGCCWFSLFKTDILFTYFHLFHPPRLFTTRRFLYLYYEMMLTIESGNPLFARHRSEREREAAMNVSDDAISAVYNTQGSISIPAPLCAPLSSHFLLFDFSGVLARDAFVARCQIISNPYISSTLGEYATSQQRLPFPFFWAPRFDLPSPL